MILLQNPNMPVPVNAVEIDAAILDIKAHLETGLSWLTNGYGRTYKNLDARNGTTVFYPEAYLGEQNNSHRYINLSPDNDKQGQCFFYVTKENISQFQPGMYSFLSYDTAIIFSVNMELINEALLRTEIYQQVLVSQVRDILTRQLLGAAYQLTIASVDFQFDNVYSEFDLADAQQLEKAPLSHFRFNCTIKLPETCPVPVIETCFSMDLDGVNEYIDCTNNSAFDLEHTSPMSFSCWVKFDTLNIIQSILYKWEPSRGIFFSVRSTGELQLHLQNNGGLNGLIITSSGANITTGIWYFLSCTYDGSNTPAGVKFYKNGALLTGNTTTANSLTGTIINTQPVHLGELENGLLNKVLWWKTELSAAEIINYYNDKNIIPKVSDLILSTDINNSTFNGTEWDIPDLTGITAGYTSINMEAGDRVEDCPI